MASDTPGLRISRAGQEVRVDLRDCPGGGILISAAGARRVATSLDVFAAQIDAIESDIQCHTEGGRTDGK